MVIGHEPSLWSPFAVRFLQSKQGVAQLARLGEGGMRFPCFYASLGVCLVKRARADAILHAAQPFAKADEAVLGQTSAAPITEPMRF